jgi:hypothetical protein
MNTTAAIQTLPLREKTESAYLLRPARVFDGTVAHS